MKTTLLNLGLSTLLFYGSTYAAPKKDMAAIMDDVTFWAKQMVEHAEFASDFTNDPTLKSKGLELAHKFQKFLENRNSNKTAPFDFLELSKEIKNYQREVKKYLKKQPDNQENQIALDLLDHMDKETDYAVKKAKGIQLTKHEEAQFWSEEHEGEAKVMSALMNKNALKLKGETAAIAKELKSNTHVWNSSLEVVEKANKELNQIGSELEKDPTKTKIPHKLAEHEKRERMRAAQTFEKFEQNKIKKTNKK